MTMKMKMMNKDYYYHHYKLDMFCAYYIRNIIVISFFILFYLYINNSKIGMFMPILHLEKLSFKEFKWIASKSPSHNWKS
jgi:hypothetical protein